MKVSLIIPVYNEAQHLKEFLQRVDDLKLQVEKELVIVNDCSTDGSAAILDSFAFRSAHRIIHQAVNQGKGAAIKVGIARATGDIMGVQDADFEYDLRDIPALIQPLLDDRADVVYGSRFKKSGEQVHRTFHYLINRALTILSNFSCGLYLTDMETCYKFFRRDILANVYLDSRRFGFEPEITAKIARLKLRIIELPVSYYPRNYLQGKKISWKDGIAALRHIIHFNFFVKPVSCFGPDLPKRYLPSSGHWL
ncbi:MAG: glycosyltransferase family 2 protein [Proteobacteria bacterium]|nr:glycosyltransferase family 2 protein [Pseudomonadota bacterium]